MQRFDERDPPGVLEEPLEVGGRHAARGSNGERGVHQRRERCEHQQPEYERDRSHEAALPRRRLAQRPGALGAAREGPRGAALHHRVAAEHHERRRDLHEREHRGRRQLDEPDGEAEDHDLERLEVRPAEHEHDPEGGEGEDEDQRRRRGDRRSERRQRHAAQRGEPARAQQPRGLLGLGIEVRPHAGDETHHDRYVVEDVRREDHPDRAHRLDGAEPEPAEHVVEPAFGADELLEGERDHERRQHEGHGQHHAREATSREAELGEDIGRRQADRDGERRRGQRLRRGEGEPLPVEAVAGHVGDRAPTELAVGREAPPDDRRQRPQQERHE